MAKIKGAFHFQDLLLYMLIRLTVHVNCSLACLFAYLKRLNSNILFIYYHPQQSCRKVILSEAYVKNSVHKGGVQGGMHGRGVMHGRGACMGGVGMVGGRHGGGCMAGKGGMHCRGVYGRDRGPCMAGGHV